MPHDPMLVEAASLPPGFCFTCGTVEGPFVDTMCSANHDTVRVYLCVRSCVTRFAALAGLSDMSEAQGQLDDTLADLAEAESKLAVQEPFVQAFKDAVAKFGAEPDGVLNDDPPVSTYAALALLEENDAKKGDAK